MGCAAKQAMPTTLEYKLTSYLNSSLGYTALDPVRGTHGADATWIGGSTPLSVEYKTAALTEARRGVEHGRVYTSPSFSVLDWPYQLTRRDVFVCGMHTTTLDFKAALIIPKEGVVNMLEHAKSVAGGLPVPNPNVRHKTTFSLKTLMGLVPDSGMYYIYDGRVVGRHDFAEAFFSRTDPIYLDLFY